MKTIGKLLMSWNVLFGSSLLQSMEMPPQPSQSSYQTQLESLQQQRGLALFTAVEGNETDAIDALTSHPEYVDLNWRTPLSADGTRSIGGQTPLILATIRGNLPAVKKLINAGADVEITDAQGKNALTYSVLFNHLDIATSLICMGNANPNCHAGLVAEAAQQQNKAMIALLLSRGADPRESHWHSRKTALQITQEEADPVAASLIDQSVRKAHEVSREKQRLKLYRNPHFYEIPEPTQKKLLQCLYCKNPAKIAQQFFSFAYRDSEFRADMKDFKNLKAFFKALPYKHNRIELASYFDDIFQGGQIAFVSDISASDVYSMKHDFKEIFAQDSPMRAWLKKTKDHLDTHAIVHVQEAVTQKDLNKAYHLLEQNRYINFEPAASRKTILTAIRLKDKAMAYLLLRTGINPDLVFNAPGYTDAAPIPAHRNKALFKSMPGAHTQDEQEVFSHCDDLMIQLLLDFGANPSYILPWAIQAKNNKIIAMLILARASHLHLGLTSQTSAKKNTPKIAPALDAKDANPHKRKVEK